MFDRRPRRDVIEVVGGSRDRGVAELLGDDADVHALFAKLGGVCVAQAVGVHALGDAGTTGQFGQPPPNMAGDTGTLTVAAETGFSPRRPLVHVRALSSNKTTPQSRGVAFELPESNPLRTIG
jgi:hypothetical protein